MLKAEGVTHPKLRLRPPRESDATEFASAHRALQQDHYEFGVDYDPTMPFSDFVRQTTDARYGINIPEGWVAWTFLVAIVEGSICGRISIRHSLNERLSLFGGHIGYAVLPDVRGRGYATEILRQGLVVARAQGVGRVLLTCDQDNIGSAKAIERNGGLLDGRVDRPGGGITLRYWID